MIKEYLKVAFANLAKSKVYSLISISSLSIGMAVSILLLIYVMDELSYDRYHENSDNIYRLCQEKHPYHAPQTAGYLADNLPEIKKFARILPREDVIIQYDKFKYKEKEIAFVDADFFRIFSFKFTSGNAETALAQPGTIVISEKATRKYFGDENPIGRVFKLNNASDYTITGVIEDIPQNSHFRYDFFLTLTDADAVFGKEMMNHWGWQNFLVYFQMEDKFSKPELEAKISQLMKNPHDPDAPLPKFIIQKLPNIHLYSSHIKNDIQPQNSILFVLIFSAIGLLILLIACFNYINLLTANATNRIVEIAVRKSFGASRKQLIMQFISESIVVLIISLCLALVMVRGSLQIFNEISGKELSFSLLVNPNLVFGILGIVSIVGILAGGYPAFILSCLPPTKVLMAFNSNGESKIQLKKILVGAQFSIVIALIACAIVMLRQISFLQQKELGFDKEAVLVSDVDLGEEEKYQELKQVLLDQTFVSSVSSANRVPSGALTNVGEVFMEGQDEGIAIPYVHVQLDYFKTLGIKAVQGRLFSDQFKTDATEAVILNATAVKSLEIKGDPIGQKIRCNWPESNRTIVGIIDDIHFESLYDIIKPIVFVVDHNECRQLMVKIRYSDSFSSIKTLTDICNNVYPDEVFNFHFLDEKLDQIYQKDKKTFYLMGYFSALAIVLACMGLVGMVSFILARRTKEIGIRKVNGAKTYEIMAMLNKGFAQWIAVAFVIACPVAWYAMNKWLENFAYRTEMSWWIFLLAGGIAMGIALLTVSFQSWRAASRNPVESLRYE